MKENSSPPTVAVAPSFPPQLLDEVEAMIAQIQCILLETLTPQQFRLVQDLRDATQVMAVARFAAADGRD